MRSRVLHSIVAVCPPGMGIGKDGTLPWPYLRNEFKHFQKMTMTPTVEGKQNVVIMGRKTWFSIPEKNRPLKNRINIVLSKELTVTPQGAHYLAKSLDDALELLETPELKDQTDLVWIIGGSSLYKELLDKPVNQRLFLTRILKEFECDTFLPEIDFQSYKLLPEYPEIPSEIQEENGIQYKFEVYEKKVTENC
ncbi:dihydrofolate reductase [Pelobates fuscus]|uniref:dihydrofolate reductase n=1 Tax=Pelobates fuscus TaxID=191477 RepID=UPI002FE44AE3